MTVMANAPEIPGEKKKGLPALAWVAIGCLGLMMIAGVIVTVGGIFVAHKVKQVASDMEDDPVATTAKILAAASPDIEFVKADKDARKVTFRDTKSGKELTVGYDDIQNGKVTFTSEGKTAEIEVKQNGDEAGQMTIRSEDGNATFQTGGDVKNLPDWVPLLPGTTPQGSFASETNGVRAQAFHFETEKPLDEVLDYYQKELERAGLKVHSRTTTNEGGLLVAASADENRSLNVIASTQDGKLEVVVNVNEKR
jgi:hypothetical protein